MDQREQLDRLDLRAGLDCLETPEGSERLAVKGRSDPKVNKEIEVSRELTGSPDCRDRRDPVVEADQTVLLERRAKLDSEEIPEHQEHQVFLQIQAAAEKRSFYRDICDLSQNVCQNELTLPRHKLSSADRRAFSVAATSVWNPLADYLLDPVLKVKRFKRQLNTVNI